MRLRLAALPGFRQDIADLPDDDVRRAALSKLVDIAEGRIAAQPLDIRVATGDLRDCRKVYFDIDPRSPKPSYRLVYRLVPSEGHAVGVQAVAVGERFESDAYIRAGRNLGRTENGPATGA